MAKRRRRKNPNRRRVVRRSRRHRWLWLLVVMLLGVGLLVWAPWRQQGTIPSGAVIAAEQSTQAPSFTLPSATGKQVDLAAYLGKQPVVLVFYMGDF